MVLGELPRPSWLHESKRLYFLCLKLNFERRRQCNLAVSPVALPDCGFRYSNPVLDGVPFSVIPNQQILLSAVWAFDQALVVRVDFAVVGKLLKRRGHDSPCRR